MACVREWQALGSDDSQPLEDAFLPQFLNFNFDNSLGEPYPWIQIPCAPSARCSPNYCRDSGCLTMPTTLYIYSTVPTRHATGTTYTAYRLPYRAPVGGVNFTLAHISAPVACA